MGCLRNWRAAGRLHLTFALVAAVAVSAAPAQAGTPCRTSGSSYSVTVCLTEPPDGATLSGLRTVTATVTVSGTNPGVQKVLFYLGGAYLLTDYSAPYTFTLPTDRFLDGARLLEVEASMRDGFVTQRSSVDVTFSNGVTVPPVNTNTFTPPTGTTPAPGRPFVLAAAGDGASGRPDEQAVTDLIASWSPNMLLYLGDVYEKGTATEFFNWYGTPDRFYGRFRAITNPTVGNHEYLTTNAGGYFDYWDNVPHYFSVNVNGWHIVSLDSTGSFAQTTPGSAQYQWLDQDLSSSSAACTIVFFHHPRWSVGQTADAGDDARITDLWSLFDQQGVDLVLNGHDHNYQRWQPLNAQGNVDASAPTEIVIGSGGHGIQPFTRTDSRLVTGFDTVADFGALKLELNQNGGAYQFINAQGTTRDSGSIRCSGAPADTTAPAPPANLVATSPGANQVNLTWTSSTDNVGVTAYEIYRNGSLLTTTGPAPSYADTTVTGGTTYSYHVKARDAAGNVSGQSNTATVTTSGTNPPVFADGFETGNLSNWTANTGVVAQQQEVFAGSWAARGTTTGAATWAYKTLGTAYNELFYRIRFKVLSQGAASNNTVNLLKLRTATGTSLLGLYRNPTGRLGYRNDVAALSTTSTTTVSTGTWHEVQIRLKINGTSGETETWYDGVRIAALSKTENFGTTPIGRLQLGENSSGRSFDIAFDEIAAGTTFISDGGPPPDTTPPSDPTNLNATAQSPTRVDLTWTASTDNMGVTGYEIFRNGSTLTSVGAVTAYSDNTVSPSTTYSYQVKARDAAGNVSGFSNTATVTTPGTGGPLVFVVRQEGSNYVAESATRTYTGDLKTVVESAVYNDLNPSGGGTVRFQTGVFDLGTNYFRLEEVSDIVLEGAGMNATTIQNNTNVSADTEPFNFKGAYRVTIRDLTVVAGGTPRTTSDAIDFDKGNDSLVQRVKITYSRGKGIIFDGKDAGWTSQGNTVLDCEISGTNNDGIQFLASSNNRVEGCYVHDTVGDGIEATKSQSIAPQPHKKSNENVIIGNTIDNAGQNGVRIHSSDRNVITNNQITNSSDDTANQDGIRIICDESITGDDNRVEGNVVTDNQATKTQTYGLNINNSICNRTFVGTNNFMGNRVGEVRDLGTNTQYGTSDTTPPSDPTNLQATAVSSSRVDLTWTASTDNVGVVAYDIYRNASLLTSVGAVTSYSDTTVAPSTTYTYQVRARDSAGNPSGLSNSSTVTTPTGPPPPSVLTFTPTDDASVRADQPGSNFGAQGAIGVDSSPVKNYLLKFNVSGVGTRTVQSAVLRLSCIDSSDSGGVFYRVLDPNSWSEGTVTWNSAPQADTAQVASLGGVSATRAYEVDITSIVTGDGLVSLRVVSNSATGNGADFSSKEGTAAPQLVVTATGGGTADTTPPSDPTNLQATAVSSSRVDLSWTASTDNVGVTAYDIYRNGSPLTSVGAVTAYSDTTASPSTTYTYQVRARDAAGNTSGLSNSDTVTTPAAADTTPPSDPTNLQATAVSSSRVDLSWTASTDNVGVTAYDIYRNAALLTSVGAVTAYSDTTASPSTTYTYQVRARDAAGNPSGLSNTATVTTPAAGGAPLFSDGFETGNFANWTANTGLVAQQQEVFAGSWAARGTTTSAATWAYKTLPSAHTELFYRIRFKVISQGASSTVNLLKLRTATGTALFGLFRNSSGNLGYRNETASISTNSTTPVSIGVWHEVQVRVRINGASGETETWFDGVRIASLSKVENFGTTPIGRLQVGENSTGKTYDVAFDDVAAGSSFIA